MRFRCCLKHRVLHYDPVTACKIINSCAFLHNLCIEHNIPEPEDDGDEEFDFGNYGSNCYDLFFLFSFNFFIFRYIATR